MKAVIHCASCLDGCAKTFQSVNPRGVIVLNRHESPYHLSEDRSVAQCGINVEDFTSIIGCVGVELGDYDMTHDWLRDVEACSKCFAYVW